MIRKFAPKYNVNWKDGKSYPLIEITTKEPVPLVRMVRQETNLKAKYFGPYTVGTDLTSLLRYLRRIFPYISQNHPGNRPCLRSHLGLCPCQEPISKYRQNLRKLILFLEGKRSTVQKKLQKEMNDAAVRQDFEAAAEIKTQLEKIGLLTAPRTKPWEYETNPNLTSDRIQNSLLELQRLLRLPRLYKIECYDISNTSGKSATGAQVVFIDGEPNKSFYRRYKIKLKSGEAGPDDFAMLHEVISRRLKSEIPLPDLMVIDGGVAQLSVVMSTVNRELGSTVNLKVIALAKRLETIYTKSGKRINLPESSPALQLLQRLRDEAHRFSRKYHVFLRKEKLLT